MTSAAACAAQIKHSVALSLGAIGAEQAIIMILTPAGIPLIWAATEAHSAKKEYDRFLRGGMDLARQKFWVVPVRTEI